MIRSRSGPGRLQRGVIILPSAFTLANLFFGIWAIVSADRGELGWAAWCIVFAAIIDTLDGGIARATRTGTRFGTELDSLVDAISFGVAPAVIVYHQYFAEGWSWLLPFVYVVAVVLRLARFNVQQGDGSKRMFVGLPSPSAAMLVATLFPFSQSALVAQYLPDVVWPQVTAFVLVLASVMMLSAIPYPALPRIGVRTRRGVFHLVWMSVAMLLAVSVPRYYFFPATLGYTCMGPIRWFIFGLLDRLPDRDPLDEPDDEEEERSIDYRNLDTRPVAREEGRPHSSEDSL